MKNLKACLSPQFSSSDSFQNIRSPSNFSAGLSASIIKEDNGLTIKDLKQEYNKALSYIDKLKIEQNNLKNTLKMTLDHKPETPLNEINHHSYNRSFSSLQTKPRIMRGDPRIKELDTENEDLKCQLDTAMVRISKLQKEKQIFQDKINQLEAQNQGSQVYIKDIKSLTHDIHILSAKLEELEQENMLLRKQNQKNHHEKENQEPSQNLLRYVAYVAKIASGMPQSNFARSCYEERFPRDIDTVEQLISGEFEPVLLRSFKYITDLLLNISSLPLDETLMNPATPTQNTNHSYFMYQSNPTRDTRDTVNTNLNTNSNILSKNSHVYDSKPSEIKKSSQRVHKNTIREPSLEYISEKRQPSQEAADNSFQENGMESSERAFSSLRQNHRLQDGYNSHKGHKKSSDFEQFKNALQKIVNPREEYMNKTTKPQRGHARHYSTMGGTSNRPQDSYRLEQGRNHSQAKKESSYRDAKSIGMSSYLDDDISQSGYRQRGNESRGVRMDESSERHGNLKNQSRVRYEETEGNLETEGQYQEENMRYEREIQQQLQAKQPKKRMKDLKGASRGGDSSYREVRDILEEDRPRYEDRRQANYSVSSTRQQVQPRHVNEFDQRDQRDQREERDTRDNRDRSNPRDQREYREQEKEHRRDFSNAREQQREYREEREHHIDRSYPREQERDQRDRSNPREQREYREENHRDRSHPREQEREYRDQQRDQQQPKRGNSRNGGYVQRERERDDYEGEEEEYQQYEQQQQQRNGKKQRGVSSREGSPEKKYKQRNAHHHQGVIPEVTAETYETRISTRIKDSTKKESHRNKDTFRTTDREGQYEPMAIRQQQQEEEEPSTARNEDEEKNELWDKNRKELAKMRKKLSSTQLNISQDSKYKDFSTFRVSFGRTESKIMKGSPSHSPGKGSPSIFDVPKRKKVDHLTSNFDIITGKNIAGERNESDRMSNVTSPVSAVSGGRWERTGRSQMSKNKIVLERSLSQPKDSLENEAESAKRVIVE